MGSTARVITTALAALLVAVGAAACDPGGPVDPDPTEDPIIDPLVEERVGDLVATHGEDERDGDWVHDMLARDPVLLTSDADLEHWLGALPAEANGLDALDDTDFMTHDLVIGAYPRCTETSEVTAESLDEGVELGDARRVLVSFAVLRDSEPDLCAWSPARLDAWAIPRERHGGRSPVAVAWTDGGETATRSVTVGSLVHSADEADGEGLSSLLAAHAGIAREGAERDALAAALDDLRGPDSGEGDPVREIDMSVGPLVVAGYHKCTEVSAVHADRERDPALLWVELTRDEGVWCDDSPLTIDIWHVPFDELAGDDGEPVDEADLGQYRPVSFR